MNAEIIFNFSSDRVHVAIKRRVVFIDNVNDVRILILSLAQIMKVESSVDKEEIYIDEYSKIVLKQDHTFILEK